MATTNDQENNPSMGTKSLKTLGRTHFYLGLYAYIDDIEVCFQNMSFWYVQKSHYYSIMNISVFLNHLLYLLYTTIISLTLLFSLPAFDISVII